MYPSQCNQRCYKKKWILIGRLHRRIIIFKKIFLILSPIKYGNFEKDKMPISTVIEMPVFNFIKQFWQRKKIKYLRSYLSLVSSIWYFFSIGVHKNRTWCVRKDQKNSNDSVIRAFHSFSTTIVRFKSRNCMNNSDL